MIRRLLLAGLIPGSIVVATALVLGSSFSVFSGSTSTPANGWTTGTVVMKNDSASSSGVQSQIGSALFTASNSANLAPGGPGITRCLTLQYTGSIPAQTRFYGMNMADTNGVSSYFQLTVDRGTATDTNGGSCSSFTYADRIYYPYTMNEFFTYRNDWSSSLAVGFNPSGPASTAIRITVTPTSGMTNSQQAGTMSLEFVFEARNS